MRHRPNSKKKPLSEKAARWFAFLKSERVLVKQTGLYTGNADVLKEVAARYKRFRLVGTPDQPLLLAPPSDTEYADAEATEKARLEVVEEEMELPLPRALPVPIPLPVALAP